MPSKDAHSSRNWAITMHAPAAMSCVSLMASETKARTVATVNAATANESCMGFEWNITPESEWRKPPSKDRWSACQ